MMQAHSRHFTLEEAESLLPTVAPLMKESRELKRTIEERLSEWQSHRDERDAAASTAEEALLKGRLDFLVKQINERLEAVEKTGALPKDLDLGLIDFPALIGGREAFLCWRLGESGIRYWHDVSEGYGGRRRLNSVE